MVNQKSIRDAAIVVLLPQPGSVADGIGLFKRGWPLAGNALARDIVEKIAPKNCFREAVQNVRAVQAPRRKINDSRFSE
jgi:hypothetical protein